VAAAQDHQRHSAEKHSTHSCTGEAVAHLPLAGPGQPHRCTRSIRWVDTLPIQRLPDHRRTAIQMSDRDNKMITNLTRLPLDAMYVVFDPDLINENEYFVRRILL
jgi:hypothetical protein